ncbi:MAG: hypothetical protein GY953_26320, partial [bacterium]|nr:hypothetical protein [bacterium]
AEPETRIGGLEMLSQAERVEQERKEKKWAESQADKLMNIRRRRTATQVENKS